MAGVKASQDVVDLLLRKIRESNRDTAFWEDSLEEDLNVAIGERQALLDVLGDIEFPDPNSIARELESIYGVNSHLEEVTALIRKLRRVAA